MSSQVSHLVKMANHIALNFGEGRDPDGAAARTHDHMQKFWTRDMRNRLAAHIAAGAEDVSPVVCAALADEAQSGETCE